MLKTNKVLFVLIAAMLSASFFYPALSHADEDAGGLVPVEMEPGPGLASHESGIHEEPAGQKKEMSLLDLVKKGGVVGYLIILLSILSLALIIDYFFSIRKSKILPAKDVARLKEIIRNRKPEKIAELEEGKTSFFTKVILAGLKESHRGYPSMIKAMEDASEAHAAGIARKTEHLSVIGNIAPMLGLLGTVIGMLRCFNEIAHMTGAIEPKQLAGGIFEALVTTCMGLIVAIPSLYCYAVFKNRVDEYTGEASLEAERLVSAFQDEPSG